MTRKQTWFVERAIVSRSLVLTAPRNRTVTHGCGRPRLLLVPPCSFQRSLKSHKTAPEPFVVLMEFVLIEMGLWRLTFLLVVYASAWPTDANTHTNSHAHAHVGVVKSQRTSIFCPHGKATLVATSCRRATCLGLLSAFFLSCLCLLSVYLFLSLCLLLSLCLFLSLSLSFCLSLSLSCITTSCLLCLAPCIAGTVCSKVFCVVCVGEIGF